jgi:hypothetical protein
MATPAPDDAASGRPQARACPVDAIGETQRDAEQRAAVTGRRTDPRSSQAGPAIDATREGGLAGASSGSGREGSPGNTTGMGGGGAAAGDASAAPVDARDDRERR